MASKIVISKRRKSPEWETILELGRRLFGGGIVPDDEMTTRLERWWLSKEFGISFGECPPQHIISVLKATNEGNTPTLGFLAEKDGSQVPFVAVQVTQRQPGTKFTEIELEAVRAYVTARISGNISFRSFYQHAVRNKNDVPYQATLTSGNSGKTWSCDSRFLQEFMWLVEESECHRYPIGSDEFRASRLAMIPSDVIQNVAEAAKLSLPDAVRLSFGDLLATASVASDGRKPEGKQNTKLPFGLQLCDVPQTLKRPAHTPVGIENADYWDLMQSLMAAWPNAVPETKLKQLFPYPNGRKNASQKLRTIIDSLGLTFEKWMLIEVED